MICCDCCGDYVDVDAVRYVVFSEGDNDIAELCPRCYDDVRRGAYWKRERSRQLAAAERESNA